MGRFHRIGVSCPKRGPLEESKYLYLGLGWQEGKTALIGLTVHHTRTGFQAIQLCRLIQTDEKSPPAYIIGLQRSPHILRRIVQNNQPCYGLGGQSLVLVLNGAGRGAPAGGSPCNCALLVVMGGSFGPVVDRCNLLSLYTQLLLLQLHNCPAPGAAATEHPNCCSRDCVEVMGAVEVVLQHIAIVPHAAFVVAEAYWTGMTADDALTDVGSFLPAGVGCSFLPAHSGAGVGCSGKLVLELSAKHAFRGVQSDFLGSCRSQGA